MFRKGFKHRDWVLTPFSSWVRLQKQNFILPDFTIKNKSGEQYHIELFHRWYVSPLLGRLELLEREAVSDFIIGVDRSLAKRTQVKRALEHSLWFQRYGFLFREIPVPGQVIKLLEKL